MLHPPLSNILSLAHTLRKQVWPRHAAGFELLIRVAVRDTVSAVYVICMPTDEVMQGGILPENYVINGRYLKSLEQGYFRGSVIGVASHSVHLVHMLYTYTHHRREKKSNTLYSIWMDINSTILRTSTTLSGVLKSKQIIIHWWQDDHIFHLCGEYKSHLDRLTST